MKTIKIIALAIIFFLAGCGDSNLERENANLKLELNNIKQKNKELAVKLAKSELLFSKKYKEEFKKEESLLKASRVQIENHAKLVAEKNAKNKYMTIIVSLVVFFLAFIGLSFFKRNEYNKMISNKETEINQLKKSISELNQKVEEGTKHIINLETRIKGMEIRAKEVSINQVVSKIDENQKQRRILLNRIEKDLIDA